jgi:uncharacterized membrane protein
MMDRSELNEIINKKTKTVLNGIEMLNEEIVNLKKTINWLYYLIIIAITINIGFTIYYV